MLMKTFHRIAAPALALALAATCLTACANTASSAASSAGSAGSSTAAASDATASRAEIESIVEAASGTDYTSVGFSTTTETTATATVNGQLQQQAVQTSMVGELDKSANTRVHMACSSQSSTALGVTSYDMFIDNNDLMVTQGDQIYRDELAEGGANAYVQSVMSVASKDEIERLLDVASSCKVSKDGSDTVISITADPSKLADSKLYDTSSLPEGSSVATFVASYTIDENNRFTSARLMSSTTGTPTYRVSQTYKYYDYDTAVLPEWPNWEAFVAKESGIMTDANGRMYLVGDDGQIYYIESIGKDGTITFDPSSLGASVYETSGGYYETSTVEYESVPVEVPATQSGTSAATTEGAGSGEATSTTGSGSTSETTGGASAGATDSTTGGTSGSTTGGATGGTTTDGSTSTTTGGSTTDSGKGRAYITAYDGTIHYLDEPGSQIRDLGGTMVFIDANGEWYFLNVEDGTDLSEYM